MTLRELSEHEKALREVEAYKLSIATTALELSDAFGRLDALAGVLVPSPESIESHRLRRMLGAMTAVIEDFRRVQAAYHAKWDPVFAACTEEAEPMISAPTSPAPAPSSSGVDLLEHNLRGNCFDVHYGPPNPVGCPEHGVPIGTCEGCPACIACGASVRYKLAASYEALAWLDGTHPMLSSDPEAGPLSRLKQRQYALADVEKRIQKAETCLGGALDDADRTLYLGQLDEGITLDPETSWVTDALERRNEQRERERLMCGDVPPGLGGFPGCTLKFPHPEQGHAL